MQKLFYVCKRATRKNDINGNARYIINLFQINEGLSIILERNNFLAGRLKSTKEGYVIKSVNILQDLKNMFKDFLVIEVI